jgi:hypothetical protein
MRHDKKIIGGKEGEGLERTLNRKENLENGSFIERTTALERISTEG